MEKHKNIYEALINFSLEDISLNKSGKNKFTGSTYSTIDDLVAAIKKPLAKNGLVIVQTLEYKEGLRFLFTNLYHISGEKLESSFQIPEGKDMQSIGASITYAKRYAISAMLNLGATEDDDGNQSVIDAANDVKAFKEAKKVIKKDEPFLNNAQSKTILDLTKNYEDVLPALYKFCTERYGHPVNSLKQIKQADYEFLYKSVISKVDALKKEQGNDR